MAGFLGLFNYSKPGPGVSKNEPQKKGIIRFFELYFRKFWKLCVANLLYVLVSLPVLTRGLADAGLTFITRNFVREKHAFVSGDFFDTIKKNWKQALIVGLINLAVTAILAYNFIALDYFGVVALIAAAFSDGGVVGDVVQSADKNTLGEVMYIVISAVNIGVGLIFMFMKYYINLMLVTFKFSIKQLYKNSAILAFVGLWRNLLLFLIMGVIYALCVVLLLFSVEIGLIVIFAGYIFLFPAFKSFLVQFTVFPLVKRLIIDPYYKDHPEEDKDARKALNIEFETAEDEEEEKIFEDVDETEDEDEDKPANTIPRQYTRQEMDKLRRKQERARGRDEDDDDTI